MTFSVEVYNKAGSVVHLQSEVALTPTRFGWSVVGGPSTAEIEARGELIALAPTLNWVGMEVIVRNAHGTAVWWGLIDEATVAMGAVDVGVSLDKMYNRVAVAYTYLDGDNITQRGTTAWVEDAKSVARYGRRELLYSQSEMEGLADADALAATLVSRLATPPMEVRPGGGERGTGVLRCRGWWDTVGWRYYKQLAGREVHETGSANQVLGVKTISALIPFVRASKTVYMVGGQHGFRDGDKVDISGASNPANNGVKTIGSPSKADPLVYTANTISFAPNNDLYDAAGNVPAFAEGNVLQVRGTGTSNSGMWQIGGIYDETPGGSGFDHIELSEDGIITQAAGLDITLHRMGYFKIEEAPQNEGWGATVTLEAWGRLIAQSFTMSNDGGPWPLHEVALRLKKTGSPSDGIRVHLQGAGAGVPDGFSLASAVRDASTLGTEYGWESFAFSGSVTLTYGTTYWLVIERTGAGASDDFYEFTVDDAEGYAGGALKLYGQGAWNARPAAASLVFKVLGKEDTGAQIARILTATAERITSVTAVTSGTLKGMHRDGDSLAADEIEDLLQQGDSSGRRLTLWITPERRALLRLKATEATNPYLLKSDGAVLDPFGRAVPPGTPMAGQWVRLDEAGLADVVADKLTFYADGAEYDCAAGRWQLTPENAPSPYDIGRLEQG